MTGAAYLKALEDLLASRERNLEKVKNIAKVASAQQAGVNAARTGTAACYLGVAAMTLTPLAPIVLLGGVALGLVSAAIVTADGSADWLLRDHLDTYIEEDLLLAEIAWETGPQQPPQHTQTLLQPPPTTDTPAPTITLTPSGTPTMGSAETSPTPQPRLLHAEPQIQEVKTRRHSFPHLHHRHHRTRSVHQEGDNPPLTLSPVSASETSPRVMQMVSPKRRHSLAVQTPVKEEGQQYKVEETESKKRKKEIHLRLLELHLDQIAKEKESEKENEKEKEEGKEREKDSQHWWLVASDEQRKREEEGSVKKDMKTVLFSQGVVGTVSTLLGAASGMFSGAALNMAMVARGWRGSSPTRVRARKWAKFLKSSIPALKEEIERLKGEINNESPLEA